ncbi:MAG: FGGY family carbohydrate kinase, partial [Eubacteriales bacterium]|nr:FGGY family carbohydrate kinase [Eubacteriales bacterium]
MGAYALAIDLGASSGRHILGHVEDGKVVLREIYRFPNGASPCGNHLCWDMEALFGHIQTGLAKCAELGFQPQTLGIDSWGVDYSLIDSEGRRLYQPVSYRDARTEAMPERLDRAIPPETLYEATGIARQSYNTVYQLMAELDEHPELLHNHGRLLFTPCYLSYRLTGIAANEYTIASTSGLLNAESRDWDEKVLQAAGIPARLLGRAPVAAGAKLGPLLPEIARTAGFTCEVILPASHDTASAFLAVPKNGENAVTLSSGTWSLLGVERDAPLLAREARCAGFTNEGGHGGKYTVLRNIMGLWILQCIRREWGERHSYAQMAAMAEKGERFRETFNAAEERFLAPKSMIEEIRAALREAGKPLPANDEELLFCVHHSLAL